MKNQPQNFAEKLAWETTSYASIEVRVQTVSLQKNLPPPHDKPTISNEHYIETASGLRYADKTIKSEGETISRGTRYFDGQKAAGAQYNEGDYSKIVQVTIQPSFGMEGSAARTSRPGPLPFFYVAAKPLHEALRSPGVLELGPSTVIKRDCVRFQFPKVNWGQVGPVDLTFHLDKQTGIPLKVELARKPEHLDSVWEALSLDETEGGRHLPLRSQETSYQPDGSVKIKLEYTIQEVKYDQTYDKAMFWPKIDGTMSVFDRINNTRKMVPAPPNPDIPLLKEAPAPAAAVPAPLIQAAPPASWFSWGVPAALILGCALVAAAILLRVRRSSAT